MERQPDTHTQREKYINYVQNYVQNPTEWCITHEFCQKKHGQQEKQYFPK